MNRRTALAILTANLMLGVFAQAADRYAVASGNWNTTSTWSATSGGAPGASIPAATDAVYITEAALVYTVTIPSDYAAACASLSMGSTSNAKAATLTFATATASLTVSGNVVIYGPNGGATRNLDVQAGTCTINGNLELGTGQTENQNNRICKVTITTGDVTVGGDLTFNNIDGSDPLQTQIVMSGGAGTFNLGGSFTINNSSGTLSAGTTSTFNFIGSSAQTIPIGVSSVVYNNLYVNNTSTSGATLSAAVTTSNVTGDLRIQSGTFSNGGYAIAGNAGKTFQVVNGAEFDLTGTSGMVTGFTKLISGGGTVDYAGTNQTVSAESYGHLTLSGSGTKTMPGSNMTLSGNFMMSGTPSATAGQALLVWGNFTIGSGCTFNAGSYTHTLKADFSNNGTFTSATSAIIFNGNANQNITGSTSVFNNVTILNAAGVTLAANITLNGTLTLTSGNITTSSWFVSIVSTGTVSRTSGHIVGNLRKIVPTGAASKTFEIGTGADYTPVSVTFGNVTASGNLAATTSTGDHANIGSAAIDPAKSVNRTWTLTNGGITFDSYSATFAFVASDVDAGANTNNVIVGKYSGSWTYPTVGTKTTTTTQITGVTSFSDFQIGESGGLPVQLSSFTAHAAVGAPGMTLEWTTISETNNYGFEVERKGLAQSDFTLLPVSFVPGHGTTLQPQAYSFTDVSVTAGQWSYRLKQIDLDGTAHYTDAVSVAVLTSVQDEARPTTFTMEQNYPNPFNPTTVIKYSLPASARVTLKLYNLVGQEVLTLLDERQEAGVRSVTLNAAGLPSGIYLYKLHAGDFVSTKRLVLLK